MKLLGKATSINVRKVLWTCTELGLDIEREDWGSGFRPTDTAYFLRLNPNAMVPVLIDDSGGDAAGDPRDRRAGDAAAHPIDTTAQSGAFVLWESNAICRYLAARSGASGLLPAAPRERARVEQWMDWQATELNNAWRYAFMALVRLSRAHTDAVQVRASLALWAQHLAILDGQLASTGAYAAGPHFTLADVVLALSVNRWNMTPAEGKPTFPHIDAFMARLAPRPGFTLHCANGLA